jgi:hypothetical protein
MVIVVPFYIWRTTKRSKETGIENKELRGGTPTGFGKPTGFRLQNRQGFGCQPTGFGCLVGLTSVGDVLPATVTLQFWGQ